MTSQPDSALPAEPTEEDVFEQKAVRLAKRDRLIAERKDAAGGAYPVAVPVTDTIPALRERFADLEAGAETGVTAGVAGRVVFSRNTGKLCFASLQAGDGSRIQAMVSLAVVGVTARGVGWAWPAGSACPADRSRSSWWTGSP